MIRERCPTYDEDGDGDDDDDDVDDDDDGELAKESGNFPMLMLSRSWAVCC